MTQTTSANVIFYAIVLFFFITIIFVIFYISRYRKFSPNQYVIHLRNGKVFRVGIGGRLLLLPLFDEVFTIPTTIQQTLLEIKTQTENRKNILLELYVSWRVSEPIIAFSKVSWDKTAENFVEALIKKQLEAIIHTTSKTTPITQQQLFIDQVTLELSKHVEDWGLTIERIDRRFP
ncbi:MAG: SPFH domain-containing protein [Candidatus Hodarchaeota archaeon]